MMRKLCMMFNILMYAFSMHLHAQGTWVHITEINGKEISWVNKILNDGDGGMWVNTSIGVCCLKDEVCSEYGDSLLTVYDIALGSNGDIWFAEGTSLTSYDGITFERHYPDENVDSEFLLAEIVVQPDGTIWINDNNAYGTPGIVSYDGDNWRTYTTEDGLLSNQIHEIAVSPTNEMWCCYGTPIVAEVGVPCYGVSCFNGETWVSFNSYTEGLKSNIIADIVIDSEGNVFVSYHYSYLGTTGGISKFNGASWEWLSDDYWGHKLAIDNYDKIWFYHDTDTYNEREYGFYDGNNGTSFFTFLKLSVPSFDSENNAWFGTADGILILTPTATSVEEPDTKPQAIELYPNYPNPFNPSTTISFSLPETSQVTLEVYSISGQKVATLADGMMDVGLHSVLFDGSGYSSSLYIYSIETDGGIETGSMLLMK